MITLTDEQWNDLLACPEWCTTDHKESHPGGLRTFHDGPTFGGIQVSWTVCDPHCPEGREWSLYIDEVHYSPSGRESVYTAEEARILAGDLAAAAEWIEAHR